MKNITLSKSFITSIIMHTVLAIAITWFVSDEIPYAVQEKITIKLMETPKKPKQIQKKKIVKKIVKKQYEEKKQTISAPKKAPPPEDIEESLPTPTEEYMVTMMPRLLKEVRPIYPPKAKKKNIEGRVVLDILIDKKGKVRDAKVLEGPGAGLNRAALKAIKRFKFEPAKMKKKKVAVRVRYSINFVLEQ